MSAVLRLPSYLGIGLVWLYRVTLGALFPTTCKYHPSCSEYAVQALRAHGLLRKVSGTHRYQVTEQGRRILTALIAARQADVDQLTAIAA